MKNLNNYDADQVIEDLYLCLAEEFNLDGKTAKQLLLNVLEEHDVGCAIKKKATELFNADPEWKVQAVEPTPDPERVLLTIECPKCQYEYWFKVRVHRPDDIRKRSPEECPDCGMTLKHPRMIAF